jgi:hypothetical protein
MPPVQGDFEDVVQLLLECAITVNETDIGFTALDYNE